MYFSLGAFLLTTPSIAEDGAAGIPYGMLGVKRYLCCNYCSYDFSRDFTVGLSRKILRLKCRRSTDVVSKSFSALIPGITILAFFGMVLKVIEITGLGSLNAILAVVIGKPFWD